MSTKTDINMSQSQDVSRSPAGDFSEAVRSLNCAVERAVQISSANIGIEHTGRQNRALFIFAKLIAHNLALVALVQKYKECTIGAALLDHFSIATLARAVIDACLMTMYISEPTLSTDEWNLRRNILYLHDMTNRKRFLSSMTVGDVKPPFFETYEEKKRDLKEKIVMFGKRVGMTKDKVSELQKGQAVFVSGARGAVREAGWNVDHFEFLQSYLSAYVHSHPVSFIRANEHGISFQTPSDFQFGISAFALEASAHHTELVNERISVFCKSVCSDPLGQID